MARFGGRRALFFAQLLVLSVVFGAVRRDAFADVSGAGAAVAPVDERRPRIDDAVLRKAAPHPYSASELAGYDGRDPALPLRLAVLGIVFDVSDGRRFYGPEGRYHALAGRDASCALAKMSMTPDDLMDRCEILTASEQAMLGRTFSDTFVAKYPVVGHVRGGAFYPKGLCCSPSQCGPC